MSNAFPTVADQFDTVEKNRIRSRVISLMSCGQLTRAKWEQVYLLADGFGTIDRDFAVDQCWDWSHVRDSSWEAIERMNSRI